MSCRLIDVICRDLKCVVDETSQLLRHDDDEKGYSSGEADALFLSELGAVLGGRPELKHDSANRAELYSYDESSQYVNCVLPMSLCCSISTNSSQAARIMRTQTHASRDRPHFWPHI